MDNKYTHLIGIDLWLESAHWFADPYAQLIAIEPLLADPVQLGKFQKTGDREIVKYSMKSEKQKQKVKGRCPFLNYYFFKNNLFLLVINYYIETVLSKHF